MPSNGDGGLDFSNMEPGICVTSRATLTCEPCSREWGSLQWRPHDHRGHDYRNQTYYFLYRCLDCGATRIWGNAT